MDEGGARDEDWEDAAKVEQEAEDLQEDVLQEDACSEPEEILEEPTEPEHETEDLDHPPKTTEADQATAEATHTEIPASEIAESLAAQTAPLALPSEQEVAAALACIAQATIENTA